MYEINEKLNQLDEEKKLKIINAGMEYFGKFGYKKANTEDIAKKAGISKGLLFYYFRNKRSFYFYLWEYCQNVMNKEMNNEEFESITDFFELIDYGTKIKLKIFMKYPFMTEFVLDLFMTKDQNICDNTDKMMTEMIDSSFDIYFRNIDFSPFKNDVDPKQIYRMIIYMSEGYIIEKKREKIPLDFEEMIDEFNIWKEMFKKMSYKEEYI